MHASDDQPRDHGKFSNRHRTTPGVELGGNLLLAGIEAPVLDMSGLTHIGTLNVTDKGDWSYEGQGLSVSLHPEAWQQIARLGGPVWDIPTPARLLNLHELTEEQRKAITDFGLAAGYVEETIAYKVTWYDDEYEEDRYFLIADKEEAEEEADMREADIEETATFAATGTFPDTTVKAGATDVEDILATVWVDQCTDLDGVWWEDRHDPDRLSAPRGVIVPNRVAAWVASATPRIG
jgi:hypothetical protein